MIKQTSHWLLLPLLLAVVAWPVFAQPPAQPPARDPVSELTDARRIFVPVEDLDVIIERDKEGVLLPRAKFDVLLTQAKANAEKNAVPTGNPLVVTSADYAARIVGDQLLIAVTAELTQFQSDWCELRFPLQRLAMEQAQVDDALAQVGRHPDGSVSLFTDGRGKHTVKLQLSTELASLGSDQSAAFSTADRGFATGTTCPAGSGGGLSGRHWGGERIDVANYRSSRRKRGRFAVIRLDRLRFACGSRRSDLAGFDHIAGLWETDRSFVAFRTSGAGNRGCRVDWTRELGLNGRSG